MKSRYVLLISGLSLYTTSSDIRRRCEEFGTVMAVERDRRERMALVEFKRSSAAADAWEDLEGIRVHDRVWRVDRARPSDFRFFGWSWFEDEAEDDRYRSEKDTRGGGGRDGSRDRSPSPSDCERSRREGSSPVP